MRDPAPIITQFTFSTLIPPLNHRIPKADESFCMDRSPKTTGNKTQTSGIPMPSNATKGLQRLRRSSKLLRCRSWVRKYLRNLLEWAQGERLDGIRQVVRAIQNKRDDEARQAGRGVERQANVPGAQSAICGKTMSARTPNGAVTFDHSSLLAEIDAEMEDV